MTDFKEKVDAIEGFEDYGYYMAPSTDAAKRAAIMFHSSMHPFPTPEGGIEIEEGVIGNEFPQISFEWDKDGKLVGVFVGQFCHREAGSKELAEWKWWAEWNEEDGLKTYNG